MRSCQSRRYGKTRECEGPPKFDVVYRTKEGKVLSRHPACFRHGLAEVDRHAASGGMAQCELVERTSADE